MSGHAILRDKAARQIAFYLARHGLQKRGRNLHGIADLDSWGKRSETRAVVAIAQARLNRRAARAISIHAYAGTLGEATRGLACGKWKALYADGSCYHEAGTRLTTAVRRSIRALTERDERELASREARDERDAPFLELAAEQGIRSEDARRSSGRGDRVHVRVADVVAYPASALPPYFDRGGAGLALINRTRTRYYRDWKPSSRTEVYLVGRDDDGRAFAHGVAGTCFSVRDAVTWIWNGATVLARQGDVGIVRGNGKLSHELPDRHEVAGGQLVHPEHGAVLAPSTGERVVRARRVDHGRALVD